MEPRRNTDLTEHDYVNERTIIICWTEDREVKSPPFQAMRVKNSPTQLNTSPRKATQWLEEGTCRNIESNAPCSDSMDK